MDAINSALSGLQAAQTSQAVTANNVANVNTPGFKSRLTRLAEMSGGGVKAGIAVDNRDGYLIPTGNPTDIAVFGKRNPLDSFETYYGKAAGNFRMDSFGNLFSPSGNLLFTGADGNVRLDGEGNLFQNGELIGTISPAGNFGDASQTGERFLSGFLMGSNVEIASEAVNNMVNLRYFQMNAITVRTADEMMGTVLDMKA